MTSLQQRVIELHEIARQVEAEVGKGAISESLRKAADDISALLKLL